MSALLPKSKACRLSSRFATISQESQFSDASSYQNASNIQRQSGVGPPDAHRCRLLNAVSGDLHFN